MERSVGLLTPFLVVNVDLSSSFFLGTRDADNFKIYIYTVVSS